MVTEVFYNISDHVMGPILAAPGAFLCGNRPSGRALSHLLPLGLLLDEIQKSIFSNLQQPIPRLPLCFASSFHILGNRLLLGILGPQPGSILGHVFGRPQERKGIIVWPVSLTGFLCWSWHVASYESEAPPIPHPSSPDLTFSNP